MFLKLELAILSVLAFLISHSYQAIIEAHLARNGRAHIKPICINPHLRVNSLYRIPPRRGLARRPQNEAFPSIPCLVSLANQAKGHQVALKSSEEQQEIKNKINQPTFQQLICDIAKIAKLEILYLTKNGTEIELPEEEIDEKLLRLVKQYAAQKEKETNQLNGTPVITYDSEEQTDDSFPLVYTSSSEVDQPKINLLFGDLCYLVIEKLGKKFF